MPGYLDWNSAMENELKVADVFAFVDGRTVFAGKLLNDADYIRSCDAEVILDGQSVGVIRIEDEMMPLNPSSKSIRSVATSDSIGAEVERLQKGNCVLRW